jgi:phosphoserine aminotransferase
MNVNRKKNFFAGPSVMPIEVLKEMQEQLFDYNKEGLSMLEASHRDEPFTEMYYETLALLREVMEIPTTHDAFFLGGGATLQFAMAPLNFLKEGSSADYIKSGTWSNKAASDAKKIGNVNIYYDGKSSNYGSLPTVESVKPTPNSSYLYLCSNETTGGIQWQDFPETGDVPLIVDMSSDLLSRPVDIAKFGLIFAGVQKNLGPAGSTLIVLRKDMAERQNKDLPTYFDYFEHAKADGLSNTPPIFSIWAINLALKWIKNNGGTTEMAKRAKLKSALLYDTIDNSDNFYHSPVDANYRSKMNVVFKLQNEQLMEKFLTESAKEGMLGLSGHRSVGGIRASIYNALPIEDVKFLADFMREFQRANG